MAKAMTPDMMARDAVIQQRRARGERIKDIAADLGMNRGYVSRIARGEERVTVRRGVPEYQGPAIARAAPLPARGGFDAAVRWLRRHGGVPVEPERGDVVWRIGDRRGLTRRQVMVIINDKRRRRGLPVFEVPASPGVVGRDDGARSYVSCPLAWMDRAVA